MNHLPFGRLSQSDRLPEMTSQFPLRNENGPRPNGDLLRSHSIWYVPGPDARNRRRGADKTRGLHLGQGVKQS